MGNGDNMDDPLHRFDASAGNREQDNASRNDMPQFSDNAAEVAAIFERVNFKSRAPIRYTGIVPLDDGRVLVTLEPQKAPQSAITRLYDAMVDGSRWGISYGVAEGVETFLFMRRHE